MIKPVLALCGKEKSLPEVSHISLTHRGLHRTYVGSVERGERNVNLDNIYVLAGALGVDARDLF